MRTHPPGSTEVGAGLWGWNVSKGSLGKIPSQALHKGSWQIIFWKRRKIWFGAGDWEVFNSPDYTRQGSLVTEGTWLHRFAAKYNPFVPGHLLFRFLWLWISLSIASTFEMGPSFPWALILCISGEGGRICPFPCLPWNQHKLTCMASSSLDIGRAACKGRYYFWQLKSFLQCFSADRRLITSCSKILGLFSQTWGLAQVETAETSC